MSIERDERIQFHDLGTLQSVTSWIRNHEEGLAEWLKNVLRAYQANRANVDEQDRVAVLLLRDSAGNSPARIGLLDVGGATLEDVTALDVWQDPNASSRGSQSVDETTQGNGGKAYMYRMFRGMTRLMGLKERRKNCKGFDGPPDSVDRGTLGFIPSRAAGRDVPDCQWEQELRAALEPYDVRPNELPEVVRNALQARASFTIVEGVDPVDIHRGRIDAETLIERLLFHDQAVLAVQQLQVFAFHSGRLLRNGRRLELAQIRPYPGFEAERIIPVPEVLLNDDGQPLSTTRDGTRPSGRVILRTSAQNMYHAHLKLRARWKLSYRTPQMIGSKSIGELAPNSPGSYFVYGEVELAALADYVAVGRVRPEQGPLVKAIDRFVAEQIRDLAREINDLRRQEQDQGQLDEVHEENRLLDRFKNRFLEGAGLGGVGRTGTTGQVGGRGGGGPDGYEYGEEPASLEFERSAESLRVAKSVTLFPSAILEPRVKDAEGNTVRGIAIEWFSADRLVAEIRGEQLVAIGKGVTEIWARLRGFAIESRHVTVTVINADHILLTPRSIEIPLGTRKDIQAEVTDDDGGRSTDVFLEWAHDSDDPLIVRISPRGSVFGNRIGQTSVRAGAGDLTQGGVWARIPVEVKILPNERPNRPGGGFPELRVTGRDIDPETGQIRPGDPERPSLDQGVSDYDHNIWWLNLEAPEAAFYFQQRHSAPSMWRGFHAQKLVEMVGQVRMKEELAGAGREERPEVWARHKGMLDDFQAGLMAEMWQMLQPYILTGQGLE